MACVEISVLNNDELYLIIFLDDDDESPNLSDRYINFQFNYSSGQPAPESITDKIYGNTLSVSICLSLLELSLAIFSLDDHFCILSLFFCLMIKSLLHILDL